MTPATDGLVEGLAPGLAADDLPAATPQCHAANLLPLADGSLGCVWFGGTQEGAADIVVWFSRQVQGQWTAPQPLSSDAERSEQNPILFAAPDGRLWLLHTAQRAGHQDTAVVRCRQSSDGGLSWGPMQQLLPDAGVFVRQPPLVHQGDWLLPVFRCRTQPGQRWSGDLDTSAVMRSTDGGRSWTEHAVPGSTGCVHMNLVRARSGGALLAFFRSRWADHIYRSVSHDGGLRWSEPVPTTLPNNNSSIQVIRLASGRLAMAFNDISAAQASERRLSLYDEIEGDDGVAYGGAAPGARQAFWGTPRAPMTVALSDDDGLSWPHRKVVERGDGYCMTNNSVDGRNRELSYPSIVQDAAGAVHLAYTHHRQRIRHVVLSEAWLLQA